MEQSFKFLKLSNTKEGLYYGLYSRTIESNL